MGLTDLWGAESGDPGPRLLDWRSRWWVVTRVGDLMVAMWVVWPADGGDVCLMVDGIPRWQMEEHEVAFSPASLNLH